MSGLHPFAHHGQPGTEPQPIKLPASLVFGIVAFLLTLLFFMMMELPTYVHDPRARWWQTLIIILSELIVAAVWIVTEIRSTRYLQPSLDRPARWFLYHLRRLPLIVVGFIVLASLVRNLLFGLHGIGLRMPAPSIIATQTFRATMLYCCWLALVFGILSFARLRQQAENLLNMQKAVAEAKLTQLKAQLRPHFLFNTLNTISALMHVDVTRADRLLTRLGDLLRANLHTSERNVVALKEELDLLNQYAGIMQERFVDRVTMKWQVAEDVLGAAVPTMLLQPLLENAFKHGVEQTTMAQTIQVDVRRDAANLHVIIHNTGSTLAELVEEGWGLRNCRERLQLHYGKSAELTLSNRDGGVEVNVTLPWSEFVT